MVTIKTFFHFPEVLLLAGIALTGLLACPEGTDLHIRDTYFVFGSSPFTGFIFYAPFLLLIFISWVVHVVLRAKDRPMRPARKLNVWMTLTCLGVLLLAIHFPYWFYDMPRGYLDYKHWIMTPPMLMVYAIAIIVCSVAQVLFWVWAAVKGRRQVHGTNA